MKRRKNSLASQKRKAETAVGAVLLGLVPLLCGAARCLIDKQNLMQIYLPASPWNDELFYYKLTENVVHFGYPQGYFGFNESHGQYLSFAAWSPVLLLFWVIWGLVFGWNLLSPILCNIALLSVSMLLFCILAKPDKRQTLAIGLLYTLFMPVTRYALSCIPEAELFALFIVFLGLSISCGQSYGRRKIGVMLGLVMLMTWMRPYLILLFLTPTVLMYRNKERHTFLLNGGLMVITVGIYAAINHFFSAPYLTDLFYTEWIQVYFEEGIFQGLHYTAWKLATSFASVSQMMKENLTTGSGLISAAGLYYFVFLALLCFLLVKMIVRFCRKDWKGFLLEGQMLLCMAGFFAADLLMYRLQEGGRHTLIYIVGCLFLLPLSYPCIPPKTNREKWILPAALSVLFLLLFVGRGNIPYEFAIPYGTEEHRADLDSLKAQLQENMELTEEAPSYENTVIWTGWDTVDGETAAVDFGAYYAVPTGFGINLCDGGYMDVNLENLQSRYIGTAPGGALEKRCQAAGGKLIGSCNRLVVYDLK